MKKFVLFFSAILLSLFQIGFVSALPHPWNTLNLLLCGVIFIGIFFDYQIGIFFALIAGVLWDVYTGFSFGGYTLALLLTLIVIHIVFENFFTNRSLYTLTALGAAGTLIFNAFFGLLHFSIFYETIGSDFFAFFGYQIFLNLVSLVAAFFIVQATSKKFQSAFLSR